MLAEQTAIIPAKLDAREVAEWAKLIRQSIVEIRRTVLRDGVDYGKIPGTDKDVLLKPGAEKMSSAFKLYPVPKLLTCVEDWKDGFFFYRYQIDMMHRETGEIWGSAIGSCNSREKKYAWRWVTESELPAGMDKDAKDALLKEDRVQTLTEFAFAINKAETSGQWAKSAEYWQMFKDAIASGKAKKVQKEIKSGEKRDAWELTAGVVKYRLTNPEICDQVNTIDKMAYKRAYVAAVLIATNASEFFTQDMEDFMSLALPDEDVVEGVIVEVTAPAAEKPPVVAVENTTLDNWQVNTLNNIVNSQRKSDTPKQASCLATDTKCQGDFAGLRDELRITSDAPYLERLGVKKYSDYTGTLDELFAAMRNLHAKFLLEGDHKPIGRTPEPVIDEPGAAALVNGDVKASDSPFDHTAPQVNPDTGEVETPRNGSSFNRGAKAHMAGMEAADKALSANSDIPADPGNPNRHKKPDNGAVKTLLDGMPTISGN